MTRAVNEKERGKCLHARTNVVECDRKGKRQYPMPANSPKAASVLLQSKPQSGGITASECL